MRMWITAGLALGASLTLGYSSGDDGAVVPSGPTGVGGGGAAGGAGGGAPTSSCDLPTTIRWKKGATAPIPPDEAQGLVVDSKLYVFGGFYNEALQTTEQLHVYDPKADTWTRLADVPEKISHASQAANGRTFYSVAGFLGDHPGGSFTHVWRYDIDANVWSAAPDLPKDRGGGAAAVRDGTLHYFGGATRKAGGQIDNDWPDHWALDLASGSSSWVEAAPMPNPRNHMGAAMIGGKIYAVGGQHTTKEDTDNDATMQAFDPEANSWSARARMPLPIGHNTAATFEWRGCLMVAGGTTNGRSQISSVLAYHPGTDTWVTVGMLPVPGRGVAAATEDEIIVAFGADTWIGTVESDIEGWGPLVELRDDTATWPNEKPEGGWWVTHFPYVASMISTGPNEKPEGGWWVTPIHATLLPSGDVLMTGWGRRDRVNCEVGTTQIAGTRRNGTSFLLDPDRATVDSLAVVLLDEKNDTAAEVLYCAGHSPMSDGRILYTGGSRYVGLGTATQEEHGLPYARLVDPAAGAFSRVPQNMKGGPGGNGIKWYPTQARLADGRVIVTGGFVMCCEDETRTNLENLSVELFDPDVSGDPWTELVAHEMGAPLMEPGYIDYTHVHVLPTPIAQDKGGGASRQVAMIGGAGKVLLFNYQDSLGAPQRFFTPAGGARPGGATALGSAGALAATGELVLAGGDFSDEVAKRIDLYDPTKDSWRSFPMGIARSYPSAVLLPDGSVLVINGESGKGSSVGRQAQLLDPTAGVLSMPYPAWPDDPLERGFHSFALLLKDGRVLIGGGLAEDGRLDVDHNIGCERPDVRIYHPPYLSKGRRPLLIDKTEPLRMTIGGASTTLAFTGGPLRKTGGVVLMALGSITHSFDMNQRYVPLAHNESNPGKVTVDPPADAYAAPPGDYILYLISEAGVPSLGVHVRIM